MFQFCSKIALGRALSVDHGREGLLLPSLGRGTESVLETTQHGQMARPTRSEATHGLLQFRFQQLKAALLQQAVLPRSVPLTPSKTVAITQNLAGCDWLRTCITMSGQVAKAAPTEVIRAAKMFTKNGRSKQVSLVTELSVGLGLGLAAGFVWKVRV